WAKETIIPKILATSNHPNYLYRMTTVFAFKAIASSINSQVVEELLLPCLESLAHDRIPNIRFNVAKCVWELVEKPKGSQSDAAVRVKQVFKGLLQEMQNDSDHDVQYFSRESLAKIEAFEHEGGAMTEEPA
ncbi:protein phosphatase 2A structural subunit, partial [Spiromyces aspiralis]